MENKVINKYPNNKIKLKYLASAFSSNHKQSDVKAEGRYPVFGASGLVGFLDIFDQNQKYIGIIKDGAGVGRSKVYEKETSILSTMTYIVPKDEKKADIAFLNYSLLAMDLGSSLDKATIPHIYFSAYGNKFVWDISLCHQKKIVSFLNRKCLIIDSLIFNESKQIEKLEEYKKAVITKAVTKGLDPDAKMKDSDVEWIGKIKQDYHCEKLKFLLSSPLLYGANESGGKQEKGCTRFIRITDIDSNGNLKDTNDNQYLSASKSTGYILKNKDILFARSGGTVGKSFLYKNPGFPCSFAGYLIKAECEETLLLPEFLYSYTKSSLYEIWKNMIFVQSTIQNIGAQRYGNLDIVIPSIAEQKQIVQYIDKKCMLIDKLIDTKNRTRKQLLNFKKSLIYEYVTGKKKVSL